MSEEQTNLNNKKLNLTITTPRGVKFVEEADMLIMRCIDGDLGVLPGHEPLSTVLGDGILKIFNNDTEIKLAVFGGVVEIDDRTVNIFSTIAQRPDEIDLERARRDLEAAQATLHEQSEELKIQSLQTVIRRSLVRVEVSLHLDDDEEEQVNIELDDYQIEEEKDKK